MFIEVRVKIKQRNSEVRLLSTQSFLDNNLPIYLVKVKSLPVDNKANQEIIELLAEFFQVSKKEIELKKGVKSNNKIFEIKVIHNI